MYNKNWSTWHFDVDINESVDPLKWILKYGKGGSQESDLELYNQVLKGGGRVGRFGTSAPHQLLGCQMRKHPTAGASTIKHFTAIIYRFPFVPGKLFQLGPMFAGKARAYPSEAPFRCSTLG